MKAQYIKIDEDVDRFYFSDREMQIPHSEDGPSIEYRSGYKSWFLNDEQLSEAEHKRRTAKETILTIDEIAAETILRVCDTALNLASALSE